MALSTPVPVLIIFNIHVHLILLGILENL